MIKIGDVRYYNEMDLLDPVKVIPSQATVSILETSFSVEKG